MNNDGVQDSIVVGFNLVTDKVRDVKNADIIAALSDTADAIELRRVIRVTDDPKAPALRIPPLRYADLRMSAKEKDPSIKFGNIFYRAMRIIKADHAFCQVRYLDPRAKRGIEILTRHFEELGLDDKIL